MNSRQMIKAVEQDYQILKYRLKRLVCNNDSDAHIIV
jgi:hypothetical protein